MRIVYLAIALICGCRCGEESGNLSENSTEAQSTPEPVRADVQPEPRWMVPAENTVLVDDDGRIRLEEELIDDAHALRSRLVDGEPPDGNPFSLEASPLTTWGRIRPILAAISEAPLPGFVRTHSALYDTMLELASWSHHPGQVSMGEDDERREPLTFVLEVSESGLHLNEHQVDGTQQVVALIQATRARDPGGRIPVVIRARDDVNWGRILEVAVAVDGALGTDRVALWNEAPGYEELPPEL